MAGRNNKIATVFGFTGTMEEIITKFCRVSRSTLNSRLQRGWTLENALVYRPIKGATKTNPLRFVTAFGDTDYFANIVRKHSLVPATTVRNRLKTGMSLEEALTTPRNNYKQGEDHHCWQGGKTRQQPLTKQITYLCEYKTWRTSVFKRDNYTCQHCFARAGKGKPLKLNAHHVIFKSTIIREYGLKTIEDAVCCALLWDTENGLTLCTDCHNILHSIEGKKQ